MKVVLASASPRRLALLEQIGFNVQVCVSAFEEINEGNKLPEALVIDNANGKGRAVAMQTKTRLPIIAADTIVVLDGNVLGKPKDEQDAQTMLKKLSGRSHRVLTGVAIFYQGHSLSKVIETKVLFRDLTEEEILEYVSTGEPLDKAGAYGIQGRGAILVEKIDGCYNNVVGLPLTCLYQMMKQIGVRGF